MEKGHGYDVELFTSVPDPVFICPICQGVLNNPVELNCQHFFCYACIVKWFKRKCECPYCRKRTKAMARSVVPIIQNMIGRLMMKCGNTIHGCPATFPLEQYATHRKVCEFRLAKCECEGCPAIMPHKDLPAHRQVCEFWKQPCRMGCGAQLTWLQLEKHNCYRDMKAKYDGAIAYLEFCFNRMSTILKHKEECFCQVVSITDDYADESSEANEDEENDEVAPNSINENASSVSSRSSSGSNTEHDVTPSRPEIRQRNRHACYEAVDGAGNNGGDEASPSISPNTRAQAVSHRHRIRPRGLRIFRQRVTWNPFDLRFGSVYRRMRVRPYCR
uniref:RING finger protein 151 n=1 Tax=Callorhinchus milii TaxID=7868 RepID=V9KYK1_CALMI